MSGAKSQQVLVPRQVYIGDTAELRCTFNSADAALKTLTSRGTKELSLDYFSTEIDSSDYAIKQVTISPSGVDFYQVTVTFVPWKTGIIIFPPLNLEDTVLEFQGVNISSLTEEKKQGSLQESRPPVLLPGTTYKLYGTAIAAVLVTLGVIRLIIKRQSVSFFIKNLILEIKYHRNRKRTEKQLRSSLSDRTLSDKDWASFTQKTLRSYLSVKYQLDFSTLATSELLPAVFSITGGIQEDKNDALSRIAEIFIRTDYIRYSSENTLLKDERTQLTDDLLAAIEVIERKSIQNQAPGKNRPEGSHPGGAQNVREKPA